MISFYSWSKKGDRWTKSPQRAVRLSAQRYYFAPHIFWARHVPSTRTQDKGTKARNVKFTSGYILNIHTPYLGTYYLRTTCERVLVRARA